MTEIRYYTDEHVSRAIVRGLRNRGIDVLTTQEADLLGAPDHAHVSMARRERRVIFTQDATSYALPQLAWNMRESYIPTNGPQSERLSVD